MPRPHGRYLDAEMALTETTMRRIMLLPGAILAAIAIQSAPAVAQQAQGKSCHMEQQCHWENFKKVCVYVKVCR
jgi:hypothetical protein